ncbi:MAG: hypothetical protein LAT67_00545 [Balneolales bacterium]|nr:hypothetical protein [Balneolales bacterium]
MKLSLKFLIIPLILAAFGLISCADNIKSVDESEPESSTNEDLNMVLGIVGNALSSRDEGLISNLLDLTADLDSEGLNYRYQSFDNPNRGPFGNFLRDYDPETGVHSIKYRRGVDRPSFKSLLQVRLGYIFKDIEGNFIEFPNEMSHEIESITFRGIRDGFAEGEHRRSEFERTAQWQLDGAGPESEAMSLSGSQQHKGNMSLKNRNDGVRASRDYTALFNLKDITIQKPVEGDEYIEAMVTGNIDYEIAIKAMRNGETETRNFRGTIELNGSGEALLRIMGIERTFNILLENGKTVEID